MSTQGTILHVLRPFADEGLTNLTQLRILACLPFQRASRLAPYLNLSVSTVNQCVRHLEETGWLHRTPPEKRMFKYVASEKTQHIFDGLKRPGVIDLLRRVRRESARLPLDLYQDLGDAICDLENLETPALSAPTARSCTLSDMEKRELFKLS